MKDHKHEQMSGVRSRAVQRPGSFHCPARALILSAAFTLGKDCNVVYFLILQNIARIFKSFQETRTKLIMLISGAEGKY